VLHHTHSREIDDGDLPTLVAKGLEPLVPIERRTVCVQDLRTRRDDRRKRLEFLARRDNGSRGFDGLPLLVGQFEVSTVRGQYAPRLLVREPTQQGSCRAQHRSFGSHKSAEHSAGLVPAQ